MPKLLSVLGGRKFIALILATVCLLLGKLESWHWTILVGAYIGFNVVQDWIFTRKE